MAPAEGAPVVLFLLYVPSALALPTEREVFAAVLARIDVNADAFVTPGEYARVDDVTPFSALDADADGRVDVAELTAWVKVTQPRPLDRPVTRSATVARTPRSSGSPGVGASPAPSPAAPSPAAPSLATSPLIEPGSPAWLVVAVAVLGGGTALGLGAALGARGRRRRRR